MMLKFKSVLFKNFVALSTLQGINLVLPFVTLPYLTAVLGVTNYGVVVMVYSIMQLLIVLCDYGFNLSATKDISIHRDNTLKINQIFSGIVILKFFLLLISLGVLIVILSLIPSLGEYKTAYLFGFGMVIGQTMTPVWLFQGMEKMKYMTITNLISKSFFTLLIFVFIKNSEDYYLVPLLYSLGFIISGMFSLVIARKKFGVSLVFQPLKSVKEQFVNSTQYFFSRASVAMYTSTNNFVVGVFLGEFYAGIFGVAEKLYVAMTVIYSPLSDAIYPYMVQKRNLKLFKKVFLGAVSFNIVVAIVTFIFAENIVYFVFGDGYIESAMVLRYFCFLGVIIVPTTLVGYPVLGAFGLQNYANYSVVVASIVHMVILIVMSSQLSLLKMVFLLIFTQLIVMTIRSVGLFKLFKTGRHLGPVTNI